MPRTSPRLGVPSLSTAAGTWGLAWWFGVSADGAFEGFACSWVSSGVENVTLLEMERVPPPARWPAAARRTELGVKDVASNGIGMLPDPRTSRQ